jgi:hypothetical protein
MMTHQELYSYGRFAALCALQGPLSNHVEPTHGHPAIEREIPEDDCPTCGEPGCSLWASVQDFEADLPDAPLPALPQDDVISLLDAPGTARWAARWIRRGARDYLREASDTTGEECARIAQQSLFFRGSGPWPTCDRRYVARV